MFSICENLKFNHLPVAGGIYDQHPQLLAEWQIIFQERAKHEEAKSKNQERELKQHQPK